MRSFPARLRSLRERRGLDRKALGELCGLSQSIVGKYERGEKTPSLRALVALADLLEVSLDDLLGRKFPPP